MTRRRKLLALVALGVAVCLAVVGYVAQADPAGVTAASFAQVEKGMTLDEVEGILGRPALVLTTLSSREGLAEATWYAPGLVVNVYLDGAGRVVETSLRRYRAPGIAGTVRYWLGL